MLTSDRKDITVTLTFNSQTKRCKVVQHWFLFKSIHYFSCHYGNKTGTSGGKPQNVTGSQQKMPLIVHSIMWQFDHNKLEKSHKTCDGNRNKFDAYFAVGHRFDANEPRCVRPVDKFLTERNSFHVMTDFAKHGPRRPLGIVFSKSTGFFSYTRRNIQYRWM